MSHRPMTICLYGHRFTRKTRARCEELVAEACATIAAYGSEARLLQQAAAYIAQRTS